jgi:hypothetical protein
MFSILKGKVARSQAVDGMFVASVMVEVKSGWEIAKKQGW